MAYNFEELIQNDFDILLFDGIKLIHIASAGGILPHKISDSSINFKQQIREVYKYRRIFESIENDSVNRDNITDTKDYYQFFRYMSKRGFYSYDRVNINDIDDQIYQLISKPKYNRKITLSSVASEIDPYIKTKYSLRSNILFLITSKEFPDNFDLFDLTEFL